MEWTEILRMVVEGLVSGSLLLTLWTLRETKRKMREEVRSMQTTNAESILRTNEEYIVSPLKREINGLRTTIRRLTKALQKINRCVHIDVCPLRSELQTIYDSDTDTDELGGNRVRDGT